MVTRSPAEGGAGRVSEAPAPRRPKDTKREAGGAGSGGRTAPLTSVGAATARVGAAQPSGRDRQEKGGAVVEGVGVALGVAGGVSLRDATKIGELVGETVG